MRILLADDHNLFRTSLRGLLETRGLEVVGEASNGRLAIQMAETLRPDLVLMDLMMPEMNGMEATRILREKLPETRVVILTASMEDDHLYEALRVGAQGYLLKDLQADSFFALLERAVAGEVALTPQLSAKVLDAFRRGDSSAKQDPDSLTEREQRVLELIVQGYTSNRELARRLEIAESTVKFHVKNILDKLRLNNRAQAVSHALRHGLVSGEDKSKP